MLYLFDIDGTLIKCHGAGRRALEQALLPLLGQGALLHIQLDGKTDPLILDEAFRARRGHGPTAEEAAAVAARYFQFLHEQTAAADAVAKLPGVDEVLAQLAARGAVLGLATGNWSDGARIKLSRVGLWSRFLLGGFGCDAAERAELVRTARRRGEEHVGRALHRDEIVVIGDTPRDIAAAQAAGAQAVGVATGAYTVDDLLSCGADAAFADLFGWMATWASP